MSNEKSPNDILIRKLRAFPKVKVQNSLMRQGDRPITLSMMFMQDQDREFIFSLLPAPKVSRIREELELQGRLKITYDQYRRAVSSLLEGLTRESGGDTLKSYIRPSENRRNR